MADIDFLAGFGLSNANIWQGFMLIVQILVVLILAGMVIYLFFRRGLFRGYNTVVEIYQPRLNGVAVLYDKGKRLRSEAGKYAYHLLKMNIKTKAFEFKHFFVNTRGKPMIKLWNPQPGVFIPMEISPESKENMKIMVDETERRQIVLDQEERFSRYKPKETFWEKYAGLIIMMVGVSVVIVCVGIMVTMVSDGIVKMVSETRSISSAIAQSQERMDMVASKFSLASEIMSNAFATCNKQAGG